ncbi:uncharacterized protein MONBRDRAFT_24352 [Monosiga brevicollis MX1]|uniref:Uncharacterized protein n=1 Tax=Monosiga brevicollis TaxID=81824 RepID=A9UW57_MONBE|nr:uncharacterized protein MONBRDRAFT_24352 [Monosiga brevicollis MX1]EDQ90504.1 predicted protein [Monosiga brevicollis MX1]|eukprot:XP_001744555.1 hypothetical protein [Monosiga brevicollis MX1]
MAGQSWEAHESVPALETLHHDLLRFRREHAELQHALQRVIAENEELYATMAEHLATREELAQAREQAEWEEGHGLDDAAADVVEEVECLRGHAEVHEAALRHLQQGYRLAKQQAEHEHQLRMAREAELGEMRTIKQSFQLELGRALQVVTQLERALQSSRDRHRERDAEEQLLRQTLTQAQAQCRNSSRDAKPVPHDSVPAKGEAKPEAAAAQSHGPLLPSPDDPAVLKRRLADLEQSLELERERSSATRARELARVMQASQEREHALQQQIATHTQEIQLLKVGFGSLQQPQPIATFSCRPLPTPLTVIFMALLFVDSG